MFSMSILDSDAFLEMPQSTQNLYMHMAIRADDDGFLGNPKRIIRMVGAGEDDYKILIAKKFILAFEEGICVIKHWLIHNTIRKDRYEETVYKDQKRLLNIKENKAYSFGLPSGNQMATTGRHSIEENSIEENSIEKKRIVSSSSDDDGFDKFWKEYPRRVSRSTAAKSWLKLKPPLAEVLTALEVQKQSDQWQKDNGKFIPHPATWLNQRRWEDEVEILEVINLDA
jgi:hypothetical protein